MPQTMSHAIELLGGPSPLTITLRVSPKATTLDIREKSQVNAHVRKLTKRCAGLYTVHGTKSKLVGVVLHLTEGFAHLVDGFRVLKVKHLIDASVVLDVRNTTDLEFRNIISTYSSINKWTGPYRNLEIPRELGDMLRSLP